MYSLQEMRIVAKQCGMYAKRTVFRFIVQRPAFAFVLVVGVGTLLLPMITVAALSPLCFLLICTDFVYQQGGIAIFYSVIYQGGIIATIIVALFTTALTAMVFASVFHSYKSRKNKTS